MLGAELRVASGKQKGKSIPLKVGKFMVGRGEDCHLRPNNELVSRHHCVFTVDEFVVRLRDLGSTNGTFVNGERIRGQVILNQGDRVAIGKLDFEVAIGNQVGAVVSGGPISQVIIESDSSAAPIGNVDKTVPHLEMRELPQESAAESETTTFGEYQTETLPAFTPQAPEGFPPPQQPTPMSPSYGMGGYGQMMPPGMGYGAPQGGMYPQMPYGQMPGYGYPGMPPMMYPGQYPGYPQMPMGMPGMPNPGMGGPGGAPVEPEVTEETKAETASKFLPTKLPDPSETGAKAPPPKAPAAPTKANNPGTPEVDPKSAAASILKQMSGRRPS